MYILMTDGTGLREISDGEYPTWSPVDNWIAHRGCYGRDCGIWLTYADSGERVRLTEGGSDGQPAWSPAGKWIAFRSDRDGIWAIYVMRPDGSDVRKMTDAEVLPLWFLEKMAWKP